jgi:hypothetical protein
MFASPFFANATDIDKAILLHQYVQEHSDSAGVEQTIMAINGLFQMPLPEHIVRLSMESSDQLSWNNLNGFSSNPQNITKWLDMEEIQQWWQDLRQAYPYELVALSVYRPPLIVTEGQLETGTLDFDGIDTSRKIILRRQLNRTKLFNTGESPDRVYSWLKRQILLLARIPNTRGRQYAPSNLAGVKFLFCSSSAKSKVRRSVRTEDISRRALIVLDLDRMANGNKIPKKLAEEIYHWAQCRLGPRACILRSSGNGWHVYVFTPRVDVDPIVDNKIPNQHLEMRRGLNIIAAAIERFFHVKVDRTPLALRNSLRIPGTPNTKGGMKDWKINHTVLRPQSISPWSRFWKIFCPSVSSTSWKSKSLLNSGCLKQIAEDCGSTKRTLDSYAKLLSKFLLEPYDRGKTTFFARFLDAYYAVGNNTVFNQEFHSWTSATHLVRTNLTGFLLSGSKQYHDYEWTKRVDSQLYFRLPKASFEDHNAFAWLTIRVHKDVIEDFIAKNPGWAWWHNGLDPQWHYGIRFVGVRTREEYEESELRSIDSPAIHLYQPLQSNRQGSVIPFPLGPLQGYCGIDFEIENEAVDKLSQITLLIHDLSEMLDQPPANLKIICRAIQEVQRQYGIEEYNEKRLYLGIEDSRKVLDVPLHYFERDEEAEEAQAFAPIHSEGNSAWAVNQFLNTHWGSNWNECVEDPLTLLGHNAPVIEERKKFECKKHIIVQRGGGKSSFRNPFLQRCSYGERFHLQPSWVQECAKSGLDQQETLEAIYDHLDSEACQSKDWESDQGLVETQIEYLVETCVLFDCDINLNEQRLSSLSGEDVRFIFFQVCRQDFRLSEFVFHILVKALPWRKPSSWKMDLPDSDLKRIKGAKQKIPKFVLEEVKRYRRGKNKKCPLSISNPHVLKDWLLSVGLLRNRSSYRKGKCLSYEVHYDLREGDPVEEFEKGFLQCLSEDEIKNLKKSFSERSIARLITKKKNLGSDQKVDL